MEMQSWFLFSEHIACGHKAQALISWAHKCASNDDDLWRIFWFFSFCDSMPYLGREIPFDCPPFESWFPAFWIAFSICKAPSVLVYSSLIKRQRLRREPLDKSSKCVHNGVIHMSAPLKPIHGRHLRGMHQLESKILDLQNQYQSLLKERQQEITHLLSAIGLAHLDDHTLLGGLLFLKEFQFFLHKNQDSRYT